MDVPALLMGLIDPAGRYLRTYGRGHAPRRHAPGRLRRAPLTSRVSPQFFAEGAVFGPDVPGGARQATAEELADMREHAQQRHDRHQAAWEDARSRWYQQALVCAREVLDSGTTVLAADHATVRGRLVRFWRGDSVLQLSSSSPDGGSHGLSMTRLARRHHQVSADVIADYLLHQVAQLESRHEP